MDDLLRSAVEQLLNKGSISEIRKLPQGEQGASGGEISYYEAALHSGSTYRFITKQATILERSVLGLLAKQRQAVPPTYIFNETTEERSCMVQLFADPKPEHNGPFSPLTQEYAKALAAIHASNMRASIAWLPRGEVKNLYLTPWRNAWQRNLEIPEFATEFAWYTTRLENCLDCFALDMHALIEEEDSCTLINGDLHSTHMRMIDGKPCFIDWEQARYSPFYLDLVNYFRKETSLVYRDALANLGHAVPVVDFLDRFHAMGRYMGFRYLEVGLDAWHNNHTGKVQRYGDWQPLRWFLYYCLELALNGR